MVLPGWFGRSWQYQIGMIWNYVGLIMYVVAFWSTAWYRTTEKRTNNGVVTHELVTAGLWQQCDFQDGSACRDLSSSLAEWMRVTRVCQSIGLALYGMSGLLTMLQIIVPHLSYVAWSRLLEVMLLIAGLVSFTSVLVFGVNVQQVSPGKDMRWGYMLALISSLSALVSAVNVWQGRYDLDVDIFVFDESTASRGRGWGCCDGLCKSNRVRDGDMSLRRARKAVVQVDEGDTKALKETARPSDHDGGVFKGGAEAMKHDFFVPKDVKKDDDDMKEDDDETKEVDTMESTA